MGGVDNRNIGVSSTQNFGFPPPLAGGATSDEVSKSNRDMEALEIGGTEKTQEEGVSLAALMSDERKAMEKLATGDKQVKNLEQLGKAVVDKVPEMPTPASMGEKLESLAGNMDEGAKGIETAVSELKGSLVGGEEAVDEESDSSLLQDLKQEEQEVGQIVAVLQSEDPSFDTNKIKSEMLGKLEQVRKLVTVAGKDVRDVKKAVGELQTIISVTEAEAIENLKSQKSQLRKITKGIKSYSAAERLEDKAQHLRNILEGLKEISDNIKEQKTSVEKVLDGIGRLDRAISKIEKKLEKIEQNIGEAETLEEEFKEYITDFKETIDKKPKLRRDEKGHLDEHVSRLERQDAKLKLNLEKRREAVSEIAQDLEKGKRKAFDLREKAEAYLSDLNEAEEIVDEAMQLFKRTEEILEGVESGEETSETVKTSLEAVAKSAESAVAGQGAGAMGALVFLASIPALALKGKALHGLKKQNNMFKETLQPMRDLRAKLEKQMKNLEEGSDEYHTIQETIKKLDGKLNPLERKVEELTHLQRKVGRGMVGEAGKMVITGFAAGALIAKEVIEAAEHASEAATAGESLTEAATHVASTAASAAGIAAGVGMGLLGILGMGLSSKALHKNRKTDQALEQTFSDIYEQLGKAQKDGNKVLENILLLKLSNLQSQFQDNVIAAVRNTLTFVSSTGGAAAGTMTVIAGGAATGALGAAVLGTVVGAAVVGGVALAGGAGYLIYKKRHTIAHGARIADIRMKHKVFSTKLEHAERKLQTLADKITEQRNLLADKNTRAERKELRSEIRALDEKKEHKIKKVAKLQAKVQYQNDRRISEKGQYKYKKYMGKFAGKHKPDLETLQSLDRQFSKGKHADTIREFLQQEKEADRFDGNLAPLEKENPNPEDTYKLLMDYVTQKVKVTKANKRETEAR